MALTSYRRQMSEIRRIRNYKNAKKFRDPFVALAQFREKSLVKLEAFWAWFLEIIVFFNPYYLWTSKDLWDRINLWLCSVKTRFTVNSSEKAKLLEWVQCKANTARPPRDFSTDWKDGIVLCALIEGIMPGTCPRYDLLNSDHGISNVKLGLGLIEQHTGIKTSLTAEDIYSCSPGIERRLMCLVSQLKLVSVKLKMKSAMCRPVIRSDKEVSFGGDQECFAKGMGLILAVKGRKARFNIFFQSFSNMNIVIEIRGPQNSVCSERITSRSPKRKSPLTPSTPLIKPGGVDKDAKIRIPFEYEIHAGKVAVSYIPLANGKHKLSIIWQGQHIMGSPYTVNVDDSVDVPQEKLSSQVVKKFLMPPGKRGADSDIADAFTKSRRLLPPAVGGHTSRAKVNNPPPAKKLGNVVRRTVIQQVLVDDGKEIEVVPGESLADALRRHREMKKQENNADSENEAGKSDGKEKAIVKKTLYRQNSMLNDEKVPAEEELGEAKDGQQTAKPKLMSQTSHDTATETVITSVDLAQISDCQSDNTLTFHCDKNVEMESTVESTSSSVFEKSSLDIDVQSANVTEITNNSSKENEVVNVELSQEQKSTTLPESETSTNIEEDPSELMLISSINPAAKATLTETTVQLNETLLTDLHSNFDQTSPADCAIKPNSSSMDDDREADKLLSKKTLLSIKNDDICQLTVGDLPRNSITSSVFCSHRVKSNNFNQNSGENSTMHNSASLQQVSAKSVSFQESEQLDDSNLENSAPSMTNGVLCGTNCHVDVSPTSENTEPSRNGNTVDKQHGFDSNTNRSIVSLDNTLLYQETSKEGDIVSQNSVDNHPQVLHYQTDLTDPDSQNSEKRKNSKVLSLPNITVTLCELTTPVLDYHVDEDVESGATEVSGIANEQNIFESAVESSSPIESSTCVNDQNTGNQSHDDSAEFGLVDSITMLQDDETTGEYYNNDVNSSTACLDESTGFAVNWADVNEQSSGTFEEITADVNINDDLRTNFSIWEQTSHIASEIYNGTLENKNNEMDMLINFDDFSSEFLAQKDDDTGADDVFNTDLQCNNNENNYFQDTNVMSETLVPDVESGDYFDVQHSYFQRLKEPNNLWQTAESIEDASEFETMVKEPFEQYYDYDISSLQNSELSTTISVKEHESETTRHINDQILPTESGRPSAITNGTNSKSFPESSTKDQTETSTNQLSQVSSPVWATSNDIQITSQTDVNTEAEARDANKPGEENHTQSKSLSTVQSKKLFWEEKLKNLNADKMKTAANSAELVPSTVPEEAISVRQKKQFWESWSNTESSNGTSIRRFSAANTEFKGSSKISWGFSKPPPNDDPNSEDDACSSSKDTLSSTTAVENENTNNDLQLNIAKKSPLTEHPDFKPNWPKNLEYCRLKDAGIQAEQKEIWKETGYKPKMNKSEGSYEEFSTQYSGSIDVSETPTNSDFTEDSGISRSMRLRSQDLKGQQNGGSKLLARKERSYSDPTSELKGKRRHKYCNEKNCLLWQPHQRSTFKSWETLTFRINPFVSVSDVNGSQMSGETEPVTDSETDKGFIDDEIPDYASLFLGNYVSFTGLLNTEKPFTRKELLELDFSGSESESLGVACDDADEAGSRDNEADQQVVPCPEKCQAFGAGVYYGQVGVKNHFQVRTQDAGRSSLTVGMQGPEQNDVVEVTITYIGNYMYEVMYEVAEPGYYVITVKWGDWSIPDSPFICKVTY